MFGWLDRKKSPTEANYTMIIIGSLFVVGCIIWHIIDGWDPISVTIVFLPLGIMMIAFNRKEPPPLTESQERKIKRNVFGEEVDKSGKSITDYFYGIFIGILFLLLFLSWYFEYP